MLPRRFRNIIIDAVRDENDELPRASRVAARSPTHERSTHAREIAAARFSFAMTRAERILMERH